VDYAIRAWDEKSGHWEYFVSCDRKRYTPAMSYWAWSQEGALRFASRWGAQVCKSKYGLPGRVVGLEAIE